MSRFQDNCNATNNDPSDSYKVRKKGYTVIPPAFAYSVAGNANLSITIHKLLNDYNAYRMGYVIDNKGMIEPLTLARFYLQNSAAIKAEQTTDKLLRLAIMDNFNKAMEYIIEIERAYLKKLEQS